MSPEFPLPSRADLTFDPNIPLPHSTLLSSQSGTHSSLTGSSFTEESLSAEEHRALWDLALIPFRQVNYQHFVSSIWSRLKAVTGLDVITIGLQRQDTMCVSCCRQNEPLRSEVELPVDHCPSGWVWKKQHSLMLNDAACKITFPHFVDLWSDLQLHSLLMMPLTTSRCRLGSLGFGSTHDNGIRYKQSGFFRLVAAQLAQLTENVRACQDVRDELERERTLVELCLVLDSCDTDKKILSALSSCVTKLFRPEYASLGLLDELSRKVHMFPLSSRLAEQVLGVGMIEPLDQLVERSVLLKGTAQLLHRSDLETGNSSLAPQLERVSQKVEASTQHNIAIGRAA